MSLLVFDLELVREREVEPEARLELVDEEREAAAHQAHLVAEALEHVHEAIGARA